MAETFCTQIRDDELEPIVDRWLEDLDSNDEKQDILNFPGTLPRGSSLLGKGKDKIMKYFGEVIRSHSTDKANPTMPKNVNQMTSWIKTYQSKQKDQAQREAEGKNGSILISDTTEDMTEITGILDQPLAVTPKGSVRKNIADLVQTKLEEQWPGDHESFMKSKEMQDIVKAFNSGDYNLSLNDLMAIIVVASGVNKDGNPQLTAKQVKQVLNGNGVGLIHGKYNNYALANPGITEFERTVMQTLVSLYAAKNPKFLTDLQGTGDKTIKASSGASRQYKLLAYSLRMARSKSEPVMVSDPENMALGPWAHIPFIPSDSFFNKISRIVSASLARKGKAPIADLAQKLRSDYDYAQASNSDFEGFYSPYSLLLALQEYVAADGIVVNFMDKAANQATNLDTERDSNGEYTGLLDAQAVTEVLDEGYKEALDPSRSGFAVDSVRQAMIRSGINELQDSDEEDGYRRELVQVVTKYRNKVLAQEASFQDETAGDMSLDEAELSEQGERFRKLTTRICEARFDPNRLREHTDCIAANLLKFAETQRYYMVYENNEAIATKDADIERMKARLAKIEADENRTEEDEQAVAKTREKLERWERDIQKLKQENEALRGEHTWRRAALKKCMYTQRDKDGHVIFKGAIDYAIGKAMDIPAKQEGETDEHYEGRKQEVAQIGAMRDQLLCRAFMKLEMMTGIHIILNSQNEFEVADDETEVQIQDNQNENDEYSGEVRSKDMMDFDTEQDPVAHLTQNVKAEFALIPMVDANNQPLLDSMGREQYYDVQHIYVSMLSMHNRKITEASDFMVKIKPEEYAEKLTAKKRNARIYPSLYDEEGDRYEYQGRETKHMRTLEQAFPDGFPTFPILEANRGRYPWIDQLIYKLECSYMQRTENQDDTDALTKTALITDIAAALSYDYEVRAMYRESPGGHSNKVFLTNRVADVEGLRAMQRMNYFNRIMLSETSVYNSDGSVNEKNVRRLRARLADLPSAESVPYDDRWTPTKYAKELVSILNSFGISADINAITAELKSVGNVDGLVRMSKLVSATDTLAAYLIGEQGSWPNGVPMDDIYAERGGAWNRFYDSVGFYVNAEFFPITTSEAGVTRQNMIAKNTFMKIRDIITYNHEELRITPESHKAHRKKLLDERRRKIDKHFKASLWDETTGRYRNELLQQLYDGKDVEFRQADGTDKWAENSTRISNIAGSMMLSAMDEKKKEQFSPTDMLAVQLSAFLRHLESPTTNGSAMFSFPILADAPVLQFTSGKVRSEDECIDTMVRFTEDELDRIEHNTMLKRDWARVQALSAEPQKYNGKRYYDAADKDWKDVPTEDKWMWKRDVLISKYLTAVKEGDTEKADKYRKQLEALSQQHLVEAKKEQNNEKIWTVDEAIKLYQNLARYIPASTMFTREMQLCQIPELNVMRMKLNTIVDRVTERMAARESTEAGKEATIMETTVYLGELFKRYKDDDKFTMRGMLDAVPMEDSDMRREIIRAYVAEAMEREYKRYLGDKALQITEPHSRHKELANLNRLESVLQGTVDFNGERWELVAANMAGEIDIDGDPISTWKLRSLDNPERVIALTDKQIQYYESREAGILLGSSTFNGDDNTYNVNTIRNFRPRFSNHEQLWGILKHVVGKQKKLGTNQNYTQDDVHDAVRSMLYNTFAHNTEMMQIMGIDPSQFNGEDDVTKRLKGLHSNGTTLFSGAEIGFDVDYQIIVDDDEGRVSDDLPNVAEKIFADRKIRTDDAIDRITAWTKMNATNAQGHTTLEGHRAKCAMGGSSNYDSQKEKNYQDLKNNGDRHLGRDYNPYAQGETTKPMDFAMINDTDPYGRTVRRCYYGKNSEAPMVTRFGDANVSAQLMAIDQFATETEFSGKRKITTVQRPSGVKSAKKGVLKLHYLKSRVSALAALAKGEITPEQFKKKYQKELGDAVKLDTNLIKFFGDFVAAMADLYGVNLDYLTFEDVDKFIRADKAKAAQGRKKLPKFSDLEFNGLEGIIAAWAKGRDNYTAKDIQNAKNMMQALMSLRKFMLPVKATKNTINELKQEMRSKLIVERQTENGTELDMNDQYIYGVDVNFECFQVRQSNHFYESTIHMGSQASFLLPSGINLDRAEINGYDVEINGTKKKVSGTDLYTKYNQVLAARLVVGVLKLRELFGTDKKALKALQKRIVNIAQNNPKYGPDIVQAVQIVIDKVGDTDGIPRFSTPLGSVAVLYKVSDLLTSFVRAETHRSKVNGGVTIIEGDVGYDDNLHIVRDNGKIVGIECYLPPHTRAIIEKCLVEKTITDNGQKRKVKVLDVNKLKEIGADKLIGYRIPTEEYHSMLPLIVKDFLPSYRGGSVVVAGEITTLTGGDNDVDKLFLMVKNLAKDAEGNLKPVEYDWDTPLSEQIKNLDVNDKKALKTFMAQLENMYIDMSLALLTDKENESRFLSPQNPDKFKVASNRVAYLTLPADMKMRIRRTDMKAVWAPDDPNWDNTDYYLPSDGRNLDDASIKAHLDRIASYPVQSLRSITHYNQQYALADSGVAIGANRLSIATKIRTGLNVVKGTNYPGMEITKGKNMGTSGLRWGKDDGGSGTPLLYAAEVDEENNSVQDNMTDFIAAIVDSAKSPWAINAGLTPDNADFAAFLLMCGFSKDAMCYVMKILNRNPNFMARFGKLRKELIGEGKPYADDQDLGYLNKDKFPDALLCGVSRPALLKKETLEKDADLMALCNVLYNLQQVYKSMRPWEKTLGFNSAKNGLSNEPASALLAIMQVTDVNEKVMADKLPVAIPHELALKNGLTWEEIVEGKAGDDRLGMWLSQMYYTLGVESFMDVMNGKLFYANPAFFKIVLQFKDTINSMSKEDAIKFIRHLHDNFAAYYLSDMKMVTETVNDAGETEKKGFTEMRNYYRYKYPRLVQSGRAFDRKGLASKYPIIRAIDFKDGKMFINQELVRNEATAAAVKSSLVKMAYSPIASERRIARDLFLYSFFTDGLRFGFGSVSNSFTASFLASPAFKEYNMGVFNMVNAQISGKDMRRFCEQFVRAHYKKYQFGPLYRMVRAPYNAEKPDEAVKEETLANNVYDEVTPQEVARLEKWLSNPASNGVLPLAKPTENVLDKHGRVALRVDSDYPSQLVSRLAKKEDGFIFRVQESYEVYNQGLFMLRKSDDQMYIVKLNDMASRDSWFCRDMTIEEQAAKDCSGNPLVGRVGDWDRVAQGRKMVEEEQKRPRCLKGIPEKPWWAKYGSEDAVENGGDEEAPGADDDMPEEEGMWPEDEDSFTEESWGDETMDGDEEEITFEYVPRRGDKTREINLNDFAGLTAPEGEEENNSQDTDDDTDGWTETGETVRFMMDSDDVSERKKQWKEKYHAVDGFTDRKEAITAAYRINKDTEQTEFIATVQKAPRGDKYIVILSDINNESKQRVWRNQYGVSVMTGTQGINSVVGAVGNREVNMVEDDGSTIDDYNEEVNDLIDILEAVLSGEPLQPMSAKASLDIARKIYNVGDRMVALRDTLWYMMKNGAAGHSGTDIIRTIMPRDADVIIDMVNNSSERNDEAVQRMIAAILELGPSAETAFSDMGITTYNPAWIDGAVRDAFSVLPVEDAIIQLQEVKRRASVEERNTRTPEERRRAQQFHDEVNRGVTVATKLRAILETAAINEERLSKMSVEQHVSVDTVHSINSRVSLLDGILKNGTIGIRDIASYLMAVAQEYKNWEPFMTSLGDGSNDWPKQRQVDALARVLTILRAHEETIGELKELIAGDQTHTLSAGDRKALNDLVNTIDAMHKMMQDVFDEHAGDVFISFVEEFAGKLPQLYRDGHRMTWKQLMEAMDCDISWLDMRARSMGETNDPVGQIFDRIVKLAKDQVREKVIKRVQGEIRDLNQMILDKGISDFEFAFEHDENGKKTGYYLSKLNWGAFAKERDEQKRKFDEADTKYRNGEISEDEYKAAKDAWDAWKSANAIEDEQMHTLSPADIDKWRNTEWVRLRDNEPDKFAILQKFTKIKEDLDKNLGRQTVHERCIQRRMTSEQRFRANFTLNPKQLWNNITQQLAADYIVKEDDYMEAGEASGTLDFQGNERLVIPAPYIRMLKNPEELSTDLVGCLVAYAYATENYKGMRGIANPLEVAFEAVVSNKVQTQYRGNRPVVERYRSGRKSKAVVKESRLLQKMRSFMDTQLYMRYIQDEDDIVTFFGTQFRKSKAVNGFLRISAVAKLGFNWLVDLASLANGIFQTNIEAAARRYFSGAALRNADAVYWKELPSFVADLANPIKQSRLALISEKLNIMQNFDVKVYNNRRNNTVAKIFNTQVAFMGTTCGNHWLYHRVAIARMLSTKVIVDGVETNLWDAFEVVDLPNGGKEARIKAGAKLEDGTAIDGKWLSEFGRETDHINHQLIGIYNRDDMNMAQKISWMRLLQAFRKHIVPQMDRRWKAKHMNEFGKEEEGFYRTLLSYLQAVKAAQFKFLAVYDELSEEDKQNVRAAITDIVQWGSLILLTTLASMIGDDDDDDDKEAWLMKICKYLLAREKHELGSMFNPLDFGDEVVNTLDQPFMGTSVLADVFNFTKTVVTPWTWGDTVNAGPFQGQSELEMRFRKLPIPILSYYRNIDKSLHGVDNSTWFYNRGYVGGTAR